MNCSLCKDKDMYQACDVDEFFWLMMEVLDELGEVAMITDADTAQELLSYALDKDAKIGIVSIDTKDYDDAYTVIFSNSDDGFEVWIDPAMGDDGTYRAAGYLTFIDYNLPDKCKYIQDVTNNPFVPELEYEFFVIGEVKGEDFEYDYKNEFDDGNRHAEVTISSNVKDFVDIMSQFFEDYFED